MAALAVHGPDDREFGTLKSLKNGDFEAKGMAKARVAWPVDGLRPLPPLSVQLGAAQRGG